MKISCIIPVHSAEHYLAAAIDSVLAQDWPLHEVILINDGSTDGSAGVLKRYGDRIQVIEQAHSGAAAARNAGLRKATGEVVAFQDADDIWPAGRLKAMAAALVGDPAADIVAGLVEFLDQRSEQPRAKENLRTLHRVHCMPSLLIRRRAIERVGMFNENLTVAEDTEWVMRARRENITFKLVDTLALTYRLHAANSSRDISRNQSNALDAFRALSVMRRTNAAKKADANDDGS